MRKDSRRLSITKSACGRSDKQFCSTLTLNAAQANHTGFYSCKYLATPPSKKKRAESTIYIFINGKTSIFSILFAHSFAGGRKSTCSVGKGAFLASAKGGKGLAVEDPSGRRFNASLECQSQPEFSRTGQSVICSLKGKSFVYFVHHCICST